MPPIPAPFGEWKSPISAADLATTGVSLSQVRIAEDATWWVEGRPRERGRCAVVRQAGVTAAAEALPPEMNARSRVHEYGGGVLAVRDSTVFFVNFEDQRIWRQDEGSSPLPITPPTPAAAPWRHADLEISPDARWLLCVRERHDTDGEAANELLAVPADGQGDPSVLVSGEDFYSFPRLAPDGSQLAWTSWNHPDMPWNSTALFVADFRIEDGTPHLGQPRLVAGGPEESVFQPEWTRDGALLFISDRTGWWNLYIDRDGDVLPLAPMQADSGVPQWVFAMSRYAPLSGGRVAMAWLEDGVDRLGILEPGAERPTPLELPYTSYESCELRSDGVDSLAFLAASPQEGTVLVRLNVSTGESRVIRRAMPEALDPDYISTPEVIRFPTPDGSTDGPTGEAEAHAIFYPPRNRDYASLPDEKPPLLVLSHGGPTAHSPMELSMKVQFWTSRGFAVVDVNYRGSTGYGRAYRDALDGQWGVRDTIDCVEAARWLAARGSVDGARMAIRGGSAGGYTTLCALVFHDAFAAGASYYGVADLLALAEETHKFESRYLDRLIGPYPERADTWHERSPIHYADRLSCPVILLQGLEDRVVPPSQAETLVAALRERGLPYAHLTFADEGHGFRRAETIRRAAEAELSFYARVFGFQPADELDPIEIENFPAPNPER